MPSKALAKNSKSVPRSDPSAGSSLRTIALGLLPLLSIAGLYTTLVNAKNNGTIAILHDAIWKSSLLPGTQDPLLKSYIGIEPLDAHLSTLVTFFAPVVDLRNGDLTLSSCFGLGQFGAAWALMLLESLRSGNKGKAVSFVGIFGLIFQNITFAVTVPVYFLIHLLTSPTAGSFPGKHSRSVLRVSSADLAILPWSIILGYIVPSVLMALPAPLAVSPVLHQQFIALWQPFPLWSVLVQLSAKFVSTIFTAKTPSADAKQATFLQASYLSAVNYVYGFILGLAIITNIPVLAISVLPPSVFPESASVLVRLSQTDLFRVFVPNAPLSDVKFTSLAEGVHNFLVWDLYIGSTAVLLWAIVLYRNATTGNADGGSFVKLLLKILTWTLVSGPIGAATALLWERDAIVGQKVKQGI